MPRPYSVQKKTKKPQPVKETVSETDPSGAWIRHCITGYSIGRCLDFLRAIWKGRGATRGRWKCHYSCFLCLSIIMMTEITFGRSKATEKSHAMFKDFYPGKRTLWSCFWNGSSEKLETFFGYVIENEALNFQSSWLLGLASEISHVDPATQDHSIPKTIFFWIQMRFLWHKLDRLQEEICDCYVFV